MAAINEPYMEVGFWQMMKKRGGWLCVSRLSTLVKDYEIQREIDWCTTKRRKSDVLWGRK
jgi:hypothetical protein